MKIILCIAAVLLYLIGAATAVIGWRTRNTVLQSVSTQLLLFGWVPLLYRALFNVGPEMIGGAIVGGFFLAMMVVAAFAMINEALGNYNDKTKKTTPITLHDFNNYVRLNPDVWKINGVKFHNEQARQDFSMTLWEWWIFRCCKLLRVDAKTRAINDVAYQHLCEYVQRDIENKHKQNQQEVQKSLDAISKTRQAQKDIIASYTEQIQEIKDTL